MRVRVLRPDAARGTVQLRGSTSDSGLTIQPVSLEPDQDEGTLTIAAGPGPKMRADSRHTVVLSGVIRFGNQNSTRTLPAFRVHVSAGKTEPPPPAKPQPAKGK